MFTLFAQFAVEDFDAWKRAIDSVDAQSTLKEYGMVEASIHRQVDASEVIIIHKFKDLETAREFMNRSEMEETQKRYQQMGIILPATMWLGEDVSQYK